MRPYLLTVLSAALCLPVSTAAPLPDNYLALARQYAPQLRFAQKEQWWPSSVDYILQYFIARDDKGKPISSPLPLSTSNLNQLPATSYLSVTDTSSNFAITKGQNPSSTSVPIYTFIAPKENGVVDLFYWVFNPFNLGKKIIALGDVGNHVGDWERMMVRTVNGVAVSADYNAHASGDGVGTMPWAEVKKVAGEDRPVGYVAYGSHGIWPDAGEWVYKDIVIYKLSDKTEDGGVAWDTKNSVVPIMYQKGGGYGGDLSWLDFKGWWGNKGKNNCWWHFIVPTCPLADGPSGPARDDVMSAFANDRVDVTASKYPAMDGPSTQTLAPLSKSNHSTFDVYLSSDSVSNLRSSQSKFVGVQVLCKLPSSGDDQAKTDEAEEHSVFGFVDIAQGTASYHVSIDACPSNSVVDSYAAGLCKDSTADSCDWSIFRSLRTYTPGEKGIKYGSAVEVADYDVWSF